MNLTTKRPLLSLLGILLCYLIAAGVAPPVEFLMGLWR